MVSYVIKGFMTNGKIVNVFISSQNLLKDGEGRDLMLKLAARGIMLLSLSHRQLRKN